MKRLAPFIVIALGTMLFGIACGFLYVDVRALELQRAAITAKALDLDQYSPPSPTPGILIAIALGPLGAGLMLAGLCMVALRVVWVASGRPVPRDDAK
ncbi:hypothetical protein BH11PLA1_BH11PLA1_05040 [soil metagenome]